MVLVLVLAFSGLFGTWYAFDTGAEALRQADRLAALTDSARRAQVNFKTQVQLWKNILLRGQDATQFQTYRERFEAQQQIVQKDLQSIQAAPELPADLRPELAAIEADHTRLTAAYAAALPAYVQSDPASIFLVDKSVQGADQALNLRIDKVAVSLADQQEKQFHQLQGEGEERYKALRLISLLLAAAVVIAIVVLGWRVSRLLRV